MNKIAPITVIIILHSAAASSQAVQADPQRGSMRNAGGACEGCDAVFEYGNKILIPVDTLPDFHEPGPKLLISGSIYQRDGKTPAKDVILYVYHTDQNGEYPARGTKTGWGRRHGYIRGWIKTGADGKYAFYTLKPGAYPQGGNPAHIHAIIWEPGVKPYWIDEYLFEGDPYLTPEVGRRLPGRGGPGVLKIERAKNGLLVGERDIILGLNIPGY